MLIYAATIFLSAFLLFQVQPLIAKFILPWFGGSAAVWSAALLFFQLLLLAGYFYAHCLIRYLSAETPVVGAPGGSGRQPRYAAHHPFRLLEARGRRRSDFQHPAAAGRDRSGFLTRCSRPPARCCKPGICARIRARIPYRLFALSNFGSLLALLSYPLIIEPRFALSRQAMLWSMGYAAFALVCGFAAWRSIAGTRAVASEAAPDVADKAAAPPKHRP